MGDELPEGVEDEDAQLHRGDAPPLAVDDNPTLEAKSRLFREVSLAIVGCCVGDDAYGDVRRGICGTSSPISSGNTAVFGLLWLVAHCHRGRDWACYSGS